MNHTDISLQDSVFEMIGEGFPHPGSLYFPEFLLHPCGMFLNNMKDLTLKNVILRWRGTPPADCTALDVLHSPGLRLIDCDLAQPGT